MVDLPSVPNEIARVRAPTPAATAQDIASPYQNLAKMLDTAGEVLMKDVAKPYAHDAGLKAVTRDADGNVQVERAPIFGDASVEFSRAVKVAAVADGEADLKRQDIALREQFRDNPAGYLKAAEEFRKKTVENYRKIAGGDVALTLGKIVDDTTTQTWRGLQNEHERLTLQRSDRSIEAQIGSARDDLVAMARGGVTTGPAFDQAVGKIKQLTQERVNNPRLAYPKEQAEYDLQHLEGELKANGFLYHVDQIYKNQSVNPDGTTKGGAANALESAKSILTDQSIKLTPQQREAYYHKAVGEVRANEAIRRQDVQEARVAAAELNQASALGLRIDPEQVDHVADVFRKAGDPAGAARLYASFARKPLNDEYGRQPLAAQTEQLAALRGAGRTQQAFNYYVEKGYTREQAAGIVGNLFHESKLNPEQVHDEGIGLGIAGWNKERLVALRQFARDQGKPVTDFQTQLEFVHRELQTTEPTALAALKGATTPEAAAAAMLHFERPRGYNPSDVTTSLGFRERVSNAKAIYGGGPDLADRGGPAVSAWLAANRQKTLQTNARASWQTITKDYDQQGIRPADAVINQVIGAARATNDADLLETIASGVEKMDASRRLSQMDLPAQHAAIVQLKQAGDSGVLSPGQASVLKDLERRNTAIISGLESNPIQTAVVNFSDRFKAPAPLDVANDQNLVAGLQYRARIAQFAAQNWRTAPLAALDKADVDQLSAALDTPDMGVKTRIFGAINQLPEDIRNATLAKLGARGPDAMVQAAAGSLMRVAPDIAQSILRGQQAMAADKRYDPRHEDVKKKEFDEALDHVLPEGAFTLEGRTDPTGAYATVRSAVISRYADLMAQDPDAKKEFKESRLNRAVTDVTGGVLRHNGAPLFAPTRGMKQNDFDRVIWGITDNDLAGVTTLSGTPVTAEYLRLNARIESVGEGRYFMRLGRDPEKPVYAYRNVNTEAPAKFVLDLRGRTPGSTPPQFGGALLQSDMQMVQ